MGIDRNGIKEIIRWLAQTLYLATMIDEGVSILLS
jgi:hypothetical protein